MSDRWEYEVTGYMSPDEMNRRGAEGWEVAAAFNDYMTNYARIIWKRRRVDP